MEKDLCIPFSMSKDSGNNFDFSNLDFKCLVLYIGSRGDCVVCSP